MADLDDVRHDRIVYRIGFEAQVRTGLFHGVVIENDADCFFRVFERAYPPASAGVTKRRDQRRVTIGVSLVGEQDVVVELDAISGGIELDGRDACLVEGIRFVGVVTIERVYVAVDQIVYVGAGVDPDDLVQQSDLVEHGDQRQAAKAWQQHDLATGQIGDLSDAAVGARDQAQRGFLEYGSQGDHLPPICEFNQQPAAVDTEVGASLQYFGNRRYALTAGADLHVETGIPVKAQLFGHVITGELVLVVRAQLQHDVPQPVLSGAQAGP